MLTARHYRKKCARAILDGRYSAKQLKFIESEHRSRVSSLEAHQELTFSATSFAQSCLDQFKHLWKGGNKLFFPHHCLDRVESYISKLSDNLQEAANLDTPNVIQHNWWVAQFMALRAQLETDKEKEETEKRFPWRNQASQDI